MFDFVKTIRDRAAKKERQTIDNFGRYRELIAKGASDGKLSKAEAEELAGIVETIGKTPDAVEADTAAFIRRRERGDVARALAQHERSHDTALAELRPHREETERLINELQESRDAEYAGLERVVEAHAERVRESKAARRDLAELEGQHWALFGLPDPAIAAAAEAERVASARKVRLVLRRTAANLKQHESNPRVIWFETLVTPSSEVGRFDRMDGCQFVPGENQSQDELDELLAALHRARRTQNWGVVKYLAPKRSDIGRYAGELDYLAKQLIVVGEDQTNAFDPSKYHFVRMPGQPQSEVDAAVEELRKRHEATKGSQPVSRRSEANGTYYIPLNA